jgi:hypothetical protein
MEKYIKESCRLFIKATDGSNSYASWIVTEEDLGRAKTAYKRKSQTALAVGSLVHKTIEHFLLSGERVELETLEAQNAMKAFFKWYDAQDEIETIETEQTVLFPYAGGTLDWKLIQNEQAAYQHP